MFYVNIQNRNVFESLQFFLFAFNPKEIEQGYKKLNPKHNLSQSIFTFR